MAAHINASTACLLLLIDLWVTGSVPLAASNDVHSFLGSRIDPNVRRVVVRTQKRTDASANLSSLKLEHFRALLSPYKTQHESTLWHHYGLSLLRITDIDGLSSLFTSSTDRLLRGASVPTQDDGGARRGIAPNSPIGLFVRRVRVEFDNLQFSDVMKLWYDFQQYRKPLTDASDPLGVEFVYELTMMENDKDGMLDEDPSQWPGADILLDSMASSIQQPPSSTTSDLERLLEFQIDQMQRRGGYVPDALRTQLKTTLTEASDSFKLSDYARFLEAWYKGDYSSCFEHLHRYYDYAMSDSNKRVYQNVLLQMATVQADFGHHGEAMAAIEQAISVARENKDKLCLHYCLSWLHQFRLTNKQKLSDKDGDALLGSEASGLEYLQAIGKKDNIPGIEIAALLNQAHYYTIKGHPPLEMRTRLQQAEDLIIHHKLYAFRAAHHMLLAQYYYKLGLGQLSMNQCSMIVSSSDATLDDIVRASCNLAYQYALAGKYKQAFDTLKSAQEPASRNLRSQQHLAQNIGLVKLQRAIYNHDLDLADRLIITLKSTPADEPNLDFVASLLEVEYLSRRSCSNRALALIENLFIRCNEQPIPDVHQRIQLMTTKALLFAKMGQPQKGFSISMRAVVAAQRSINIYALLWAICALAGVLVGLEQWEAAFALVESARGRARETQDQALLAELTSTGTYALLGRAEAAKKRQPEVEAILQKAATWAKESEEAYGRLEDYAELHEILLKRAQISRGLGDEEKGRHYDEQAEEKRLLVQH